MWAGRVDFARKGNELEATGKKKGGKKKAEFLVMTCKNGGKPRTEATNVTKRGRVLGSRERTRPASGKKSGDKKA